MVPADSQSDSTSFLLCTSSPRHCDEPTWKSRWPEPHFQFISEPGGLVQLARATDLLSAPATRHILVFTCWIVKASRPMDETKLVRTNRLTTKRLQNNLHDNCDVITQLQGRNFIMPPPAPLLKCPGLGYFVRHVCMLPVVSQPSVLPGYYARRV